MSEIFKNGKQELSLFHIILQILGLILDEEKFSIILFIIYNI